MRRVNKVFPHGTNSIHQETERISLWQHVAEALLTAVIFGAFLLLVVSVVLCIDRRDPFQTIDPNAYQEVAHE